MSLKSPTKLHLPFEKEIMGSSIYASSTVSLKEREREREREICGLKCGGWVTVCGRLVSCGSSNGGFQPNIGGRRDE